MQHCSRDPAEWAGFAPPSPGWEKWNMMGYQTFLEVSNMESKPKIRFFFGSNTAVGFRSYFEQLLGPNSGYRLFILKGGPGTGKSSLMKKMGHKLSND